MHFLTISHTILRFIASDLEGWSSKMPLNVKSVRKLLPTLLLGVAVTILAMLFNRAIYTNRISAMALGNRILPAEIANSTTDGLAGYGKSRHGIMRAIAGLLNVSDDLVRDAMYAIRGSGRFKSTKDKIAVIAVDENSMIRHGAWPWPRSDIATLLEKVSSASVVGMDLLFPNADRTSLYNAVDQVEPYINDKAGFMRKLEEGNVRLDNDLLLVEQIAKTRVVLGTVLYNGLPPLNKPADMKINHPVVIVQPSPGATVSSDNILLKGAQYALTNIPGIRDVTPQPLGEGFMNVFPSPQGIVRGIPAFAHINDDAFSTPTSSRRRIAPSIALELMRVLVQADTYALHLRGNRVFVSDLSEEDSGGYRWAVKSVVLQRNDNEILRIPLNELGEMDLSMRAHARDYTIYPAWEVLEGMHDDAFKDKAVLIGSTVDGVGYVISTGLPSPEISVLDIHATMLSAMLKRDFMDGGYRADHNWQQIAILASGLAVTVTVLFWDVFGGLLAALLAIISVLTGNYFLFFKSGMDVGVTLPVLATLAVLSVLAVSNHLMVGRDRRFIRKAFQLNVSPSILGYLESHPDQLSSLQGDYRHMTVMFSDIRGFTSLSEKMTPPDLARFLNEYFTPMSDIVMRNTGTVDKFIGDGLMAFWNAPADDPHHARDAARSALDMLAELEELQPGWTARGLPRISIGCGINTGPMFAGYMGSEQRKNYTVMGDNVNIASRLETLNKTYMSSILITESTRNEIGNEFISRVVDKVRVSGKDTPVVIYELLGHGPASEEMSEELAAFNRVVQLYQEREFATAESLLKELVFIRPAPVYKMYLDRLAIYKALPPPANWDGTFTMTK